MKKYILKSLFVSVLCMLAASCQDTEFAEAVDSSKAQVMFSIAMDSPAARSRANWGQDYSQTSDLGDEYDNRIDLDQFIVKIEADGKTYNVTDIIKWKEGESNEHKFVGIVKTQNDENVGDITLQKAKISVYANMGTDANANFANMTFDQDAENIPMWGALTVENLKFAPGKRTSVDDIYLLRAMAKFQVTLGDAAIEKGYTLAKASLNKFNLTGNNMPTGYAGATSTMSLDMEGVLNENISKLVGATELTKTTEDGKGWVIYLPEISNTTASELKMLLTFSNGSNEKIETEVSVKDYTTANTGLVNIVRNHWYKYVIEDIVNAEPVVKYETLDWETININVGGEGFLALSTDLVEIYNANTGQLKFTSSSPITITRADVYEHKRNGEIVKRQEINNVDPVDAYYINKFGVLIQLPTDESNPESVILANTSAVVDGEDTEVLNGNITINSPFMGNATATEDLLKSDSHDNTIRYLEFLVTNEDGLSATFRVMQYPPVVITNQEGYFSYRDDQKLTDDQAEASHYHNYIGWGSLHLTALQWYNIYDWTPTGYVDDEMELCDELSKGRDYTKAILTTTSPIKNFEVINYGNIGLAHRFLDNRGVEFNIGYGGLYRSTKAPTDYFLRHRYLNLPSGQTTGVYSKKGYYYNKKYYDYPRGDMQGLAIGPIYQENGKKYRKQYVGNAQPIFYNLYVSKVYKNDGVDANGLQKKKGQADINSMTHAKTTYYDDPISEQGWVSWGLQTRYANHRMYNITLKNSSDKYMPGKVELESMDGDPDTDINLKVTVNSVSNAKIVSPSFMLASELGETRYQEVIAAAEANGYVEPTIKEFYMLAVDHCKQYVETTYEDKDGDAEWDEDDPDEVVKHYHDWRLPTKAEIEMIIEYQAKSRAMDKVLRNQYYFCVTGNNDSNDLTNIHNWVSSEVNENGSTGYYIRCVRDVKPGDRK